MAKRGKRYLEALAKVDRRKFYPVDEAIALAKEIHPGKFDETVEIHLRTGLDPRHAEQHVRRAAVQTPGLGRELRRVASASARAARHGPQAGAAHAGGGDPIRKIEQEGWTDFDVALATRDLMGKVGRLGRILGPRGLMPNPRSGTVVAPEDVGRAVREAKQGRVEFRVDRLGNIHAPIGKVSFDAQKLKENLAAFMEAIQAAKPAETKGQYIRAATLTTTMGPGIRLDLKEATSLTR